MNDTNTIELNGKHYDALSGTLLGVSQISVASIVPVHVKKGEKPYPDSGHMIDDITRAPGNHAKAAPKPSAHQSHHAKKPTRPHHAPLVSAHRPKAARTLMRSAVAKPVASFKPLTHAQLPAGSSLVHVSPKPRSADHLDAPRLTRARHIAKSHIVHRFQDNSHTVLVKRTAPLAVHTPPHSVHSLEASHQPRSLAELAIDRAVSHEQVPPRQSRRYHRVARALELKPRTLTILAVSFAVILLVSFFTYQNAARIDVRIAAARAGIHASLPGYKPGGFAFSSPITYGPGEVAISFHSNTDQRHFSVIQQASAWDAQTLRDTFVASISQDYRTLQAAGRTVYTYGQGNATWVKGGLQYELVGNANLSTSQILALATSM